MIEACFEVRIGIKQRAPQPPDLPWRAWRPTTGSQGPPAFGQGDAEAPGAASKAPSLPRLL